MSVRYGWLDHPDERKVHEIPTPWTGGLGIGLPFLGFTLAWSGLPFPIWIGAMAIMLLGFIDDLKSIPAKLRLLIQCWVLGSCFFAIDLKVGALGHLFGTGSMKLLWFAWPFTLLAGCGVVNSINLMDGVDGLAGGLVLITLMGLAAAYAMSGYPIPDSILFMAVGLISFLILNARYPGHPVASVYLGDSGSYLLGFLLVFWIFSAISGEDPVLRPIEGAWLLAFPVVHTIQLMVQRSLRGTAPMKGGRDHLHYFLIDRRDWSHAKVTQVFLIIQILLVAVGVLGHKFGMAEESLFLGILMLIPLHLVWTAWAIRGQCSQGLSQDCAQCLVKGSLEKPECGNSQPTQEGRH